MIEINTIVPIPSEVLLKVLSNPDSTLVIDYENSGLKDRLFLVYLNNLKLKNIKVVNIGLHSRYPLVDAYIKHGSTLNVPELLDSVVYLLLSLKQVTLGSEQLDSLVDFGRYCDNPEFKAHLFDLAYFLDSIAMFVVSCNNDIPEFKNIKDELPKIMDVDIVGNTFVNLFKHDVFNTFYYTQINFEHIAWYTHQFEKPIYGGVNLYYVIVNSSNLMLPLITLLLYGFLNPLEKDGDELILSS